MIPQTGIVQRRGLDNALMRVTIVRLNANKPCVGSGSLHEVEAVRFDNGLHVFWFATDDEARKAGWL